MTAVFGAVTLTMLIPMESLNVSSGSYVTSYSVMMPFWSMGGIGPQVTVMVVEESASAVTLTGELEGADENGIVTQYNYPIRRTLSTYQPD